MSDAQIEGYLTDRRLQLYAVHEAVQHDDALKELAQTPLFLSIMAVAYKGYSLGDLRPLLEDVGQRQYHLYQTYIRRAFGRSRDSANQYSHPQSLAYLAYLAQQLAKRDRYLFFFEDLQPDWLPPAADRRYRLLSHLFMGLGFGLVFAPVLERVLRPSLEPVNILGTVLLSVILMLFFGWSHDFSSEIYPVEELALHKPTRADLSKERYFPLTLVLIGSLAISLTIVRNGGLVGGIDSELFVEIFFGLVIVLSGLILIILRLSPSRIRSDPGEGIGRSGRNGLIVGLIFGLVFGLIFGLVFRQGFGLVSGSVLGGFLGLTWYGGVAFVHHYLLRWQLQRENLLPFRLRPFLDAMAGRIILQRTGPSYRFIHRTLQEHFAALTEGEIEALAREIEAAQSA